MKLFSILITAFYLILNSCSNPAKPGVETQVSTYPPKDSLKITAIDSAVWISDKLWKPDSTNFHTVAFNQRDTLKYMEIDGKAPRISSIFMTDSSLIWVVFHLENDNLKLVRYREKSDKPAPSVKEVLSYHENGKIFFSKERGKVLTQDEGAASFRSLTFEENKRPPAEVLSDYEQFWKMSKEVVDKDIAARKQAH
jgi:hypothetical protein